MNKNDQETSNTTEFTIKSTAKVLGSIQDFKSFFCFTIIVRIHPRNNADCYGSWFIFVPEIQPRNIAHEFITNLIKKKFVHSSLKYTSMNLESKSGTPNGTLNLLRKRRILVKILGISMLKSAQLD